MNFSAAEVQAYYAARVPALKITNHREWRGPCPVHNGKRDSFSVNAETGLAQCHSECARGWDVMSFEMTITAADFPKAKAEVFKIVGRELFIEIETFPIRILRFPRRARVS